MEAANPLRRESAGLGEPATSWTFGEEISEGAIRIAMCVEESQDSVEPIPIVAQLDEAVPVRLKAVADDVVDGEPCLACEPSCDGRLAMKEFRSELDRRRRGGISYCMYPPAKAVACLEHDGRDAVFREVSGGGQPRGTSSDNDDVSRGWHRRDGVASLVL